MATTKHNVRVKFTTNITELDAAEKLLKQINREINKIKKGPMSATDIKQLETLKAQHFQISNISKTLREQQETTIKNTNKATEAQKKSNKEQEKAINAQKKEDERRSTLASRTSRALGQSFLEAPLYSASFALMAGIAASIQQFVEFDKILTRIGIVANRSAESMKTFKEYAIETGKALGTTGKIFAEASLIFIQQGGLAADYASRLAEASIKLANITGARSDDTSEYITAIANSFNLLETAGVSAGDRIVDMLAALDAATGASADEIANAFKKSASSFATSGFSPEQSAAMLAVIAEVTRQAPELIGTGMKTLIGNLAEVRVGSTEFEGITNKLQDLAKQFGISFSLIDEYTGDVKDVQTILSEIANIYNTVGSNAAKNALIEAVAGKEQRDRFIALVENWDRVAEVTEIATNSTGAAQAANERYLDSIDAKIQIVKADLEGLINDILSSELFKDLLDQTSVILNNFRLLISEGNAFLNVLRTIGSVALPLIALKGLGGAGGIVGKLTTGQGGGLKGIIASAIGGGALASGASEEDITAAGKGDKGAKTRIRSAQLARGIGGGAISAGLAIPGVISTVQNNSLLTSEKTLSVIGQLLPAIGALFGPVGILVGSLGSLAISFLNVNKSADAARKKMAESQASMKEAFETNADEIKRLYEVVSRSGIDKTSYEYIESANKLAAIIPKLSAGQDEYGNVILRNTDILKTMISLEEKRYDLELKKRALELPEELKTLQETIENTKEDIPEELNIRVSKQTSQEEEKLKILENQIKEKKSSLSELRKEETFKESFYISEKEQALLDEIDRLELESTRATTKYGAQEYKSVNFSKEELLNYENLQKFIDLTEDDKKKVIDASNKIKENTATTEMGALEVQINVAEQLEIFTKTNEDLKGLPNTLQALNSLLTDPYSEFAKEISESKDIQKTIDSLKNREDFVEKLIELSKKITSKEEFKKLLSDKDSQIFKEFIVSNKEEQINLMAQWGIDKSDYAEILKVAYENINGFRQEFETFSEEQQKLIVSNKLTGAENPLQTLFNELASTDGNAAAKNIRGQINGIVSTIQSSTKPLAQKYQELLEIQLEYLSISTWLDSAMKDYKIDDSEKRNLQSLPLKRLSVNLESITTSNSGDLINPSSIPGLSNMYQGSKFTIGVNETTGPPTKTKDAEKVDLIQNIIDEYDLLLSDLNVKQAKAIDKLNESIPYSKEWAAAQDEIIKLAKEELRLNLAKQADLENMLKTTKNLEEQKRLRSLINGLIISNIQLNNEVVAEETKRAESPFLKSLEDSSKVLENLKKQQDDNNQALSETIQYSDEWQVIQKRIIENEQKQKLELEEQLKLNEEMLKIKGLLPDQQQAIKDKIEETTDALDETIKGIEDLSDEYKKAPILDSIRKSDEALQDLSNTQADYQNILQDTVQYSDEWEAAQKELIQNSKDQIVELENQIRLNEELLRTQKLTAQEQKSIQDQIEQDNRARQAEMERQIELEEDLFNAPYLDSISKANEALEDQNDLLSTLNKSDKNYLSVSDGLIARQIGLYNAKLDYINALEAEESLSASQLATLADLRDEVFLLGDAIKKASIELALEKFYKAMYGEVDLDRVKERYQTNLDFYDDLIDAHEQIIEKTRLELEIQKEIETTTDNTYKTNLKYLQSKIQDGKLTKQQILAVKSQITLLKALSEAGVAGEAQQFKLTRGATGAYRFAPTVRAESTAERQTKALEAATQFETEAIDKYREISDKIFAVETQAGLMTQQGRTAEAETLTALAGSLRGQLGGQSAELEKGKVITALVEQGQLALASKVTTGQVSIEEAMSGMTAERRAALQESIAQSKISVLAPDVAATEKLVFTNEKLITALAQLTSAIQQAYNLVSPLGPEKNIPLRQGTQEYVETRPEYTIGKGPFVGGAPLPASVIEENIKKLQDEAFVQSEIERANSVIAWRQSRNLDTTLQDKYLEQLEKREAGTFEASDWEKNLITKMETGGYTGDFSGGKMAVLHEKELVLNKLDTDRILRAVELVRTMPQIGGPQLMPMPRATEIPENKIVNINANFPNVSSAEEIKRALSSMSSQALQYAYRTKSY